MYFDLIDNLPHGPLTGDRKDMLVKFAVQRVEFIRRPLLRNRLPLMGQICFQLLQLGGRSPFDTIFQNLNFHDRAHVDRRHDQFHINQRYLRSPLRQDFQQAVVAQPQEYIANRGSGHLESPRDFIFADQRSRFDFQIDNFFL